MRLSRGRDDEAHDLDDCIQPSSRRSIDLGVFAHLFKVDTFKKFSFAANLMCLEMSMFASIAIKLNAILRMRLYFVNTRAL